MDFKNPSRKRTQKKLENIVVMVDGEIVIEYDIPEIEVSSETCGLCKDLYMIVTFSIEQFKILIDFVKMG